MSTTHLKIYFSASSLNIFLDSSDEKEIIQSIVSGKKQWLSIKQKSGNVLNLKNKEVVGFEKIEPSNRISDEKEIPIKKLAELSGIHPITITRLFSDTLLSHGKIRKATKETISQVIEYLEDKGRMTSDLKKHLEKLA